LPDKHDFDAEPSDTILQASLRAGVPHTHACGGNARCTTCRVMILDGVEHCTPRNPAEQSLADRYGFDPTLRLACQTHLYADVTLRRLVLDEEDMVLLNEVEGKRAPQALGQEKPLAILFADIRGFTSFSEAQPAYDVIHVLNRYFQRMGRPIKEHGGQIDNYMGDGLMALFGEDDPTDATLRAVRAGLGMLEAMDQLKPYLHAVYGRAFDIGVGIHYGEAVVGTIGTAERMRKTAIGDAVNLAARVEAANKAAGTRLLISDAAREQVEGRVRVGRCVRVPLAGKTGEHALYEIVSVDDSRS
jgi:adenylate cyclase